MIPNIKNNAPFTNDVFISSNRKHSLELKINYKSQNKIMKPISYSLKHNGKIILDSKIKWYMDLWIPYIERALSTTHMNRVLIIGGGNQLLSNYILENYPCNITILDEACNLYFQETFKKTLKIKDFVNEENKKLFPIDMSLRDAYEDECISDGEFDLILVDNFPDSYKEKTKMYEPDIAELYYKLLKDKGSLIIRHDFSIRKYNPEVRATYDLLDLQQTKDDVKYYKAYLAKMEELLCETDYTYKKDVKVYLYSKVYNKFDYDE